MVIFILIIMDISAYFLHMEGNTNLESLESSEGDYFAQKSTEPWYGDEEAWSQFGRTPTRNSSTPAHSPNGGPGQGSVEDVQILKSITDPVINWQSYVESDGDVGEYGIRGYGTAVGDFSNQVTRPETAIERCGENHLFSVFVARKSSNSGNDWLVITEGDTNREVWRVDLGAVNNKGVKPTPIIYDINSDGALEIILAFDTNSGLNVEVWGPQITCSDSGWQVDGHTTEVMWSLTDPDYKLEAPNLFLNNGHAPTTQALLADLEMDGDPEIVLTAININSENPAVIAIPLTAQGPPEPLWEVELDSGTHPSDPTWVALDEQNSAILVTTIDSNNGNMWAWRLSGSSGSVDWNGLSLGTPDGDTNTPHIRLPGPVIVELDGDVSPEVVFTVPSDFDGSSNADGASFHAWELTDASEIWSFRAQTGFADAPPLPVDGDGDGIHERICWITWFLDGTFGLDRHARVGCHDVEDGTPDQAWINSLDYDGNVPNEGIAVSQPIAMDLDSTGSPEIIIAYGNELIDFDGENGFKNQHWDSSLSFNHRTWASPSVADLDGDGHIDILVGDILVSQGEPDIAPKLDGRGISFSPSQSLIDPGASVTITGQFQNLGTKNVDEPVDAVLKHNGNIIATHRVMELEPISPSGDGSVVTFSATWIAELGSHEFSIVIDPHNNLTQSRYDNDNYTATLDVTAPYELAMSLPPNPIRIDPGSTDEIEISVTAVGRTAGDWTMDLDLADMPENWSVTSTTPNGTTSVTLEPNVPWKAMFNVFVPAIAEGRDVGSFILRMTLDSDNTINRSLVIPIEVNLTQGISAVGPRGTGESSGIGIVNQKANAWFMVENLGNAEESISIQWTSSDWGVPEILDKNGQTLFTITLPAKGTSEYLAQINVQTPNVGESVQNKLTLCIDISDEEICKEIDFTFTSNGISILPPHVRSNPLQSLSWEIGGKIPSGHPEISWEMDTASMLQSGWIWTAEGALSSDGNTLTLTGNEGESVDGWLNLTLPEFTPPQLHEFEVDATGLSGYKIDFTLHILQYYRSEIELVSPTEQPYILDVNTESQIVLRLQNIGNGEDTFTLKAEFEQNENFSSDPGVIFDSSTQDITLGVQTTIYTPLKITLPENTDARKGLKVKFTLESQGNSSVVVYTHIILEARQDHRWSFNIITESNITALPGELSTFEFNATNIGNYNDTLDIDVVSTITYSGNDVSTWNIIGTQVQVLDVNSSSMPTIQVSVPTNSWNGTIVSITVVATTSNGEIMDSHTTSIEVGRINGWNISLQYADLDIDAAGDNVTLEITQMGNSPSSPYIIPVLTSSWSAETPSNFSTIDPYQSFLYNLQITPPENSLSGEISNLRLIVKDAVGGFGRVEIDVPLRVDAKYSFIADNNGEWLVNENGGAPLAWIKNNGNALNTISANVVLPNGWSISGELETSLSAGQTKGMDLILVPPSTWDELAEDITIQLSDTYGNTQSMTLTATNSEYTWSKSPVFVGIENDLLELHINPNNAITTIASTGDNVEKIDSRWWIKLDDDMSNSLLVTDASGSTTMKFTNFVDSPAKRDVNCQFKSSTITDMEDRIFSSDSIIANCVIENGTEDFRWSVLITTTSGDLVTHIGGVTYAGESQTINLTSGEWVPNVGIHDLTVNFLDRQGYIIESETSNLIARKTGWNIGISSIEQSTSNDDILLSVGLSRINFQTIENAICTLTATSSTWESQWDVDITGGTFAPIIEIYNPPLTTGDEILFDITCQAPWDIDDDITDNQETYIMEASSINIGVSSNTYWTLGSAVFIIGVAWILGFAWPAQTRKIEKKKKAVQSSKKTEKLEENEESISLEENDEDIIVEKEENEKQLSLSAKAENKAKSMVKEEDETMEMNAAPPESIANLKVENEDGDKANTDLDSRIEEMLRRRKR